MKHSLQLKLSQHLTLTPHLQQSIKVLQLSTLELNQEIERLLQDNPLLEREDMASELTLPPPGNGDTAHAAADSTKTRDSSETELPSSSEDGAAPGVLDGITFDRGGGGSESEDDEFPPLAEQPASLRTHLAGQVYLLHLSDRDKQLLRLLVDSLDDDGYLSQSLEEIGLMLPPELDVAPEELSIALQHLQHMDPPGVGARNLSECLALQLKTLPDDTPYRDAALDIVQNHLDMLAAKDFTKLKRILKCDESYLHSVQKLITSLNPKPGRDFLSEETRYVIADVIVRKVNDVWVASLNTDAMPRLRVNHLYVEILKRNRGANSQQLTTQLQEARWLIKNVQQRFETILRVSKEIVDRQRNFLEHGEVAMRPLVMREIADTLGLHESTISRVTTNKFMHTPRGIFELKYFFGSHVSTETGGAASSTAIRALIKKLVSAENTRSPLSDGQISELLGQQGIVVARRTIAKYRGSLQILPVSLRKTL